MRIGEIAALVGVTPRAVRHYHQAGLPPEPPRRANGYREYGVRDAVLLARIRRLTELGLGLDEVRGVLADVRVPLGLVSAVRHESLFTHEKTEGELNLAVGSQTTVTLVLTEPVDAPRLLGAPRPVRVVRVHADDPRALVRALREALSPELTPGRTAPSPIPGPPPRA